MIASARRLGKLALGLAVLGALYLGVAALARLIKVPFPSNLVALFVLLALLAARVLPKLLTESIEAAADLLLKHLSLLFVPAAVAVVRHASLVKDRLGEVTLVLVVSTVFVLLLTGLVAERLLPRDAAPPKPPPPTAPTTPTTRTTTTEEGA